MIDLVLIRPNDTKAVYGKISKYAACEPPIWAATIAAFARKQGINVAIIDSEVLDLSPLETAKRAEELNPNLVGIIVTGTHLSASTQKMQGAGEVAKAITSIKKFMWGLHPSSLPENTLKNENIDYVVKGEGLNSICQLVKYCSGENVKLSQILGLYSNEYKNPVIEITDINDMPVPAWELLPMEKYFAHNWHVMGRENASYGVVMTSLGCPFNCSFCAASSLFGENKVRFKSPIKVIEEIDNLVNNYNVKYIKILDECFVLNKSHVEEICDLLISRNYDVSIWAYARIDTVNEQILEKLAKAKIDWLCYGIESINENSMDTVNKGQYSAREIEDIIKKTKDTKINVLANFMFGLPEDTMQSMEKTLKFARKLNPEWINLYCTMAYPGSELYKDCIKNKVDLPESWIGYSQLSYECMPLPTKYISSKEVLAFRDEAFNAFFEDNNAYFENIKNKFGQKAVDMIKNMLGYKLERKILEV